MATNDELQSQIAELEIQKDYWRRIAKDLAYSGRCHSSEECNEEPALRASCTWWNAYSAVLRNDALL